MGHRKISWIALLVFVTAACRAQDISQLRVVGEPPATFTAHGDTWQIKVKSRIVKEGDPGYYARFSGWTDCEHRAVELLASGNHCDEADALVHELMHVGMCGGDFEASRMSGHYAIEELAGPLSRIIGQNPGIAGYLSEVTAGCK